MKNIFRDEHTYGILLIDLVSRLFVTDVSRTTIYGILFFVPDNHTLMMYTQECNEY